MHSQDKRQIAASRKGTKIGIVIALGIVGTMIFFLYQNQSVGISGSAHPEPVLVHTHVLLTGIDIPAGIGVKPELWHDHSLDSFGANGYAPMHTHDNGGTVHIESKVKRTFTLSEFLSIGGVKPSSACLVAKLGDSCEPVTFDHILQGGETIRLTR